MGMNERKNTMTGTKRKGVDINAAAKYEQLVKEAEVPAKEKKRVWWW